MRLSSNPQLRAAHKELLLMRAELERAELVTAIGEARETVMPLGWLRLLAPLITRLRVTAKWKGVNERLRRHPWRSFIAALLFMKPLRAKAKPVFKLAGLAFTAWQAWRIWQQFRRGNVHSSAAGKETR